jgi:hypothetical protein
MRPLNLICTFATLDIILEMTFIREELLGGLERPLRIRPFHDADKIPSMDDALFLVLDEDLVGSVQDAVRRGCRNIGVFHMGDEFHDAQRAYYSSVDYVLRNYYRDDVLSVPAGVRCRRVAWVPNGYRSGVGPRNVSKLVPHSLREQLLFFAGCATTGGRGVDERREMLEVIRLDKVPATVITTDGFGRGLAPGAYGALMENSKFALVPGGRSAETIRLYDALEMGTIPISLRHAFLGPTGPMPDAPFVFLDSWHDLAAWVAANADPVHGARHAEHQLSCISWWSRFKRTHRNQVAELIGSAFGALSAAPSRK